MYGSGYDGYGRVPPPVCRDPVYRMIRPCPPFSRTYNPMNSMLDRQFWGSILQGAAGQIIGEAAGQILNQVYNSY
jgi:hypothetical protein